MPSRTPALPRIDVVAGSPSGARDVVVLAHGGQEHSYDVPTDFRTPLLRMWPFAAAAAAAAPDACVALVRYRYRGWNGDKAHAGTDLHTVLGRLPAQVERVALVGHSMGGRAVLANAGDARVAGVLALAPWLPDGEALVRSPGGLIVTAHGTDDSITDPLATSAYVRRLRSAGEPVAEFAVEGDGHAMLHRHRSWSDLVRRFVSASFGSGDPLVDSALTTADAPAAPLPGHGRTGRAGAVLDIAWTRLRHRPRPAS